MTFRDIYNQAKQNEQSGLYGNDYTFASTRGMSYKDFKKEMKFRGLKASDRGAKQFFYKRLDEDQIPEAGSDETIGRAQLPTYQEEKVSLPLPTQFTPWLTGKIPQLTGKIPQLTGKIPQLTGRVHTQQVSEPQSNTPSVVGAEPQESFTNFNEETTSRPGYYYPAHNFIRNVPRYFRMFLNWINESAKNQPSYMKPSSVFNRGGAIKYQQGGKMSDEQLQEAFMQFLMQKSGAKSEQELKQYVQSLGEDGLQQAYAEFTQYMQQQAQRAARGAKLQYLKKLKNQCADDEQLVYFKKGGSVECGCVKKHQDGGKTQKKKSSAVEEFKNRKKQDQATKDSIEVNDYQNMEIMSDRPGYLKPNPNYKKNGDERAQLWVPDRTKAPYKKTEKKEDGGKVKKNCVGGFVKKGRVTMAKSGKACPKCGKVHSGPCKHKDGGSLNSVPFIKKVTQ